MNFIVPEIPVAYLIVDLDLTLICSEPDEVVLDRSVHTLYPANIIAEMDVAVNGQRLAFPISIINPVETSDLIETACTEYDGIIFLTAGCWSEHSIKAILKDNLNVSESTQAKIDQGYYLNPINTQGDFFGLNWQEIAQLVKRERFRRFCLRTPELKDKHFVALDDSTDHVDSFNAHERVRAVLATTNQSSKAFYQEAVNALARAKRKEMGEAITPGFDLQFGGDESADFDFAPIDRRDSAPANLSPQNAFFAPPNLRRTQSEPELSLVAGQEDDDLESSYDSSLASDEINLEHYLRRNTSYDEYMARHRGIPTGNPATGF